MTYCKALPGRGRNLAGMDSQVLRPMITALTAPGSFTCDVTALNQGLNAIHLYQLSFQPFVSKPTEVIPLHNSKMLKFS